MKHDLERSTTSWTKKVYEGGKLIEVENETVGWRSVGSSFLERTAEDQSTRKDQMQELRRKKEHQELSMSKRGMSNSQPL